MQSAGPEGEDRILVYQRPTSTVLAVLDGAGNGGRGGRAADTALAGLRAAAQQSGFVDWRIALCEIDQHLHHIGEGGETTCVVVEIAPAGAFHGAAVGDSGAVMLPRGGMPRSLTGDQDRSRLGSGQCAPLRLRSQIMGQLLLATDGLLKYLPWSELKRAAAKGVDGLVNGARMRGGGWQDDVGAILVE